MPQKALVCAAKGEGGEGVDVDASYEALLKEIALQEFASGRYGSSERAFRREVDACGAQEAALREEIAATTAEIEELKRGLEAARAARVRHEQYDALRGAVAAHPARGETQGRMTEAKAAVERLEAQAASDVARAELRRKQVALLLHAADELTEEVDAADTDNGSAQEQEEGEADTPKAASGGSGGEEGELAEEGEEGEAMDVDK